MLSFIMNNQKTSRDLLLISERVLCLYLADLLEDILCGTFTILWKKDEGMFGLDNLKKKRV